MMTKTKKKTLRKPDPRGYGITVSAYLEPEVYERLVRAAATDRRNTSQLIALLIERALPEFEAKLKP